RLYARFPDFVALDGTLMFTKSLAGYSPSVGEGDLMKRANDVTWTSATCLSVLAILFSVGAGPARMHAGGGTSAYAFVSATKTVSGTFNPGGTITYTVTLTNGSGQAQLDNPGPEFNDVLPSSLTLVSATATSGTAVAAVATNTVTWNGSIAA